MARPASDEAIVRAEARLGLPLPTGFARLLRELGACDWPTCIFGPDALVREEGIAERPAWLVAFATDGGGNDDCFDVRSPAPELPIVFWDHEVPRPLDQLDSSASEDAFLDWLEERIHAALTQERRERRAELELRITTEMERMVPVSARGFSPSPREVVAATQELGKTAPEPWRYFLCTFGCWERPVRFLAPSELVVEHDRLIFAHSMDDAVAYSFEGRGETATVVAMPGAERWTTFEEWLLVMLERASIAAATRSTWTKVPIRRRRTLAPDAD